MLRESEIVWNCSDACLVHLADLKLKKSTLKLGEEVGATIFVSDCLKVKNYFDRDLPQQMLSNIFK